MRGTLSEAERDRAGVQVAELSEGARVVGRAAQLPECLHGEGQCQVCQFFKRWRHFLLEEYLYFKMLGPSNKNRVVGQRWPLHARRGLRALAATCEAWVQFRAQGASRH